MLTPVDVNPSEWGSNCIIHLPRAERNIPEPLPNVFRMGVCYTVRNQDSWSDVVTREPKESRELPGYYSYLLRVWRERGRASVQWRASLQDPHSSERVGFAHLDELLAFLREQTGLAPPAEDLVNDERSSETGLPSEEGGSE